MNFSSFISEKIGSVGWKRGTPAIIVETQQSIFIQVFSSFNNNSNTSRDFAWNVIDMILPCKFIVYDYSIKFGFACFTYSFIVYHKIIFSGDLLLEKTISCVFFTFSDNLLALSHVAQWL